MTEAIARVTCVIASGGSKYAAVAGWFGASDYAGDAEQQIGTMIKSLLLRGIDDGTLRGNLTVDELAGRLPQHGRPLRPQRLVPLHRPGHIPRSGAVTTVRSEKLKALAGTGPWAWATAQTTPTARDRWARSRSAAVQALRNVELTYRDAQSIPDVTIRKWMPCRLES